MDIEKSLTVTRNKLRSNFEKCLQKLTKNEWRSLLFLILDENTLVNRGFNYCHYVQGDKYKDVVISIETMLDAKSMGTTEREDSYDAIIQALYVIGRYDILVDSLDLCLDHSFHQICDQLNIIPLDRIALYNVFESMSQETADHLIATRLPSWHCPESNQPLELTFCRNLSPGNYFSLFNDMHSALQVEKMDHLARLLESYQRSVSPITMNLPSSSHTFSDDFYALPQSLPYGLCLIINIKNFMPPRSKDDDIPLEVRHGSDIDEMRLEGTFKLFGFNVIHLNNPDYEELSTCFSRLRTDSRLYAIACLAICIMTHGDEADNLYLHDRSCIPVTDLRKLCYAQALIGKPRLYFVQACRGDQSLRPVFLQRDSSTTASNSESDCLISAATVRGYSAMRSQSSGSWYITDLCCCLQEFGHTYPLKTVLMKTRDRLQKRVDKYAGGYVTQISEDKSTLVRDVQLLRAEESIFLDGILDLVMLEVMEEEIDWVISEFIDEAQNSCWFRHLEGQLAAPL